MIIGYGADLQQSTITVQQGGVLILDGSTVKVIVSLSVLVTSISMAENCG